MVKQFLLKGCSKRHISPEGGEKKTTEKKSKREDAAAAIGTGLSS